MCSIKIQTENFHENTTAPPQLPIGNASALRALRGVHNKQAVSLHRDCVLVCSVVVITYQLGIVLHAKIEMTGDNQGLFKLLLEFHHCIFML